MPLKSWSLGLLPSLELSQILVTTWAPVVGTVRQVRVVTSFGADFSVSRQFLVAVNITDKPGKRQGT